VINKGRKFHRQVRAARWDCLPKAVDIVPRYGRKACWIWLVWAGWAWGPIAYGDGALPNARVLGVNEGALSYCGVRDPAAAARLRQKIEQLVQVASAQQLAEVRNSDEYRKAYDSVVDFVAKIDEHNVKRFCAQTPVAR